MGINVSRKGEGKVKIWYKFSKEILAYSLKLLGLGNTLKKFYYEAATLKLQVERDSFNVSNASFPWKFFTEKFEKYTK